MSRRGFTLTEIVVVLAVLGVILAIALPAYGAFNEQAQAKACTDTRLLVLRRMDTQAQLRTDLDAEALYALVMDPEQGAFSTEPACPAGGTYSLVRSGDSYGIRCSVHGTVLAQGAMAQGALRHVFDDSFDLQGPGIYNFGNYRIEDGVLTDDSGLIFFDVEASESYRVATTAILSDSSWGYGLLIESTLPEEDGTPVNDDSGWAVQFDRFGTEAADSLVVRERNDGNEGSPLHIPIRYADTQTPELDESWWESEHELTVEVIDRGDGVKAVSLYVDGNRIQHPDGTTEYTLDLTDKVPEDGRLYVGLRTWNDDVSFRDLNYESID